MYTKESTSKTLKILILGYTKSGKTTAAELLCDRYHWHSANVSDYIINQYCQVNGINENEIRISKESFRDDLYNYGRKHQLMFPLWGISGAMDMHEANILTGVRNPDELQAAKAAKIFDLIIWISRDSCHAGTTDKLGPDDADLIIANNDTIVDLEKRLQETISLLLGPQLSSILSF